MTQASDDHFKISLRKARLLGGAAAAALILWCPAAYAQDSGGDQSEAAQSTINQADAETPKTADARAEETTPGETIVVTGSRIERAGFNAPTPTTVVNAAEIRKAGRTDVAAALDDLPQFKATDRPTTNGTLTTAGNSTADLRGLGDIRTLVLVNGRRQVGAQGDTFDLSAIPFTVIDRIEVVTGGASAAWGSGAVAGVVNIILAKNREGLDGEVQYGISSRGDGREYKIGLGYGLPFADGRGNVTLSGEYVKNYGIYPRISRSALRYQTIANPDFDPDNPVAGVHALIVAPDVHRSNVSEGGLILSGFLRGNEFLTNGGLAPFDFGNYHGNSYQSGGSGTNDSYYGSLSAPRTRKNIYATANYDFSDAFRLSGTFSYSESKSVTGLFPNFDNFLFIPTDNAYLPESIRDELIARGSAGFRFGKVFTDMGNQVNTNAFKVLQFVVGADGSLGGSWKWNAYYSRGRSKTFNSLNNNILANNYFNATDAVIDPITGDPVCRSTLTNPGDGCVPYNLLGPTASSQAARDYVTGTSIARGLVKQDVAAASIQGEPFSTWAGPVSIVAGAEWRKEHTGGNTDAHSAAGDFLFLNFGSFAGGYTVKEAFAETVIPLASNIPLIKSLELNGAVRVSDYSNSGTSTTWKGGLSWDISDDLRIRATRSRDIRSPALSELFGTGNFILGTYIDPDTNQQNNVVIIVSANTDLKPEKADTTTAGFIYKPSWARGLQLSLDYYSIKIKGVIANLGAQEIVQRCSDGDAAFCALIDRDPDGNILQINEQLINIDKYETSGVDTEISYTSRVESLNGNVGVRLLASYVDKLAYNGQNSAGDIIASAVPHWRGIASVDYEGERFGAGLRARYIGSGYRNHNLDYNDNHINARVYLDLDLHYDILKDGNQKITLFGNVSDLLDTSIPKAGTARLYDVIGRYMTVGARVHF